MSDGVLPEMWDEANHCRCGDERDSCSYVELSELRLPEKDWGEAGCSKGS